MKKYEIKDIELGYRQLAFGFENKQLKEQDQIMCYIKNMSETNGHVILDEFIQYVKEGLRPILCFIEETREYLLGKLRKGTTVDGKEAASFIADIDNHLPGCVQNVLLRADGEFLCWEPVKASIEAGFKFIIANRGCTPVFDPDTWY